MEYSQNDTIEIIKTKVDWIYEVSWWVEKDMKKDDPELLAKTWEYLKSNIDDLKEFIKQIK